MDPVTLTAVSMGATALGGAVSSIGQLQGGKSAKSMYEYRAGVSEVNRVIAEQNADYDLKVGEAQAQRVGMEGRYKVGQQVARQAASGIDINRGSKSRVIESVHEIAQQDQAVVRHEAAKRAYDHRVQALEHSTQGQIYRAAGAQAKTASKYAALGSILGTAGSVGSKWTDARTRGIFGDGAKKEDMLIYGPGY